MNAAVRLANAIDARIKWVIGKHRLKTEHAVSGADFFRSLLVAETRALMVHKVVSLVASSFYLEGERNALKNTGRLNFVSLLPRIKPRS